MEEERRQDEKEEADIHKYLLQTQRTAPSSQPPHCASPAVFSNPSISTAATRQPSRRNEKTGHAENASAITPCDFLAQSLRP